MVQFKNIFLPMLS